MQFLERFQARHQSQRVPDAANANADETTPVVQHLPVAESSLHDSSDDASSLVDEPLDEPNNTNTTPLTLSPERQALIDALEQERSAVQTRQTLGVVLACLFLPQWFVQACLGENFGLFLFCLLATSWAARWHRYHAAQAVALRNRVEALRNAPEAAADLGSDILMSFQAQLAMAIMESQQSIQQQQNAAAEQSVGIDAATRSTWKTYKASSTNTTTTTTTTNTSNDANCCSICLCELDEGGTLCELPCSHVYHADCIGHWTEQHTTCPLCNANLMQTTANANNAAVAEIV